MKHTLRCHDFGYEHTADRWVVEFRQSQEMGHGPKSRQPARGCGQDRRRAEAWSRGPGFRGCDRGTGHERVATGPMRVFAVRSPKGPLFLASTRHPSRKRLEPAPPSAGPLSLGLPIWLILAAPRFALSTILARNARAFHYVRDSTLSERRRTVNGGPVSCRDADGARRIVMNSRSWTWVQTSLLWHQRWFRINAF